MKKFNWGLEAIRKIRIKPPNLLQLEGLEFEKLESSLFWPAITIIILFKRTR